MLIKQSLVNLFPGFFLGRTQEESRAETVNPGQLVCDSISRVNGGINGPNKGYRVFTIVSMATKWLQNKSSSSILKIYNRQFFSVGI